MLKFVHLSLPARDRNHSRGWYVDTLRMTVEFNVPERRITALPDTHGVTIFRPAPMRPEDKLREAIPCKDLSTRSKLGLGGKRRQMPSGSVIEDASVAGHQGSARYPGGGDDHAVGRVPMECVGQHGSLNRHFRQQRLN